MDKILDQIIIYWPYSLIAVELFIIMFFLVLLKADNYIKQHKMHYALQCERALNNQNTEIIDNLRKQLHEGNIKYLEMKKEFLDKERELCLKYQTSVFETTQEIEKVKRQIDKLKSK